MPIYDSYAALLEAGGARRGSQATGGGGGRIKGSPVIKKALNIMRESVGAPLSPARTPVMSRTPNDRERADVDQVDLAQHQPADHHIRTVVEQVSTLQPDQLVVSKSMLTNHATQQRAHQFVHSKGTRYAKMHTNTNYTPRTGQDGGASQRGQTAYGSTFSATKLGRGACYIDSYAIGISPKK